MAMTQIFRYVSLETASDGLDLTHEFRNSVLPGLKCPKCRHTRRTDINFDIPVQQKFVPEKFPLTFVGGWTVIQDSFADQLGINKKAYPEIEWGRIKGDNGNIIEGWSILFVEPQIILRGRTPTGKHSSYRTKYRTCPECGRVIYDCYIPEFICPKPDPTKKIFAPTLLGSFVVRVDDPDEISHIKRLMKGWGYVRKLDVLDKPRDGIEAILEPYRVLPLGDQKSNSEILDNNFKWIYGS